MMNNSNTLKGRCLWCLWAAVFMAFSCSDDSDGANKALVNVRLIDAPGDFDQAWIEILGVDILMGRGRDAGEAYWEFVPYSQPDQQVDVSKLVADGVLLIGRTELPVGSVNKLRLRLGDEHFLTAEGEIRPLILATPEAAEVELEVNYIFEGTTSYDLYLDFDLERSIAPSPDSTTFVLTPVVRSFLKHERSELAGRIRPAQARPVLFAVHEDDTVTTLTNADGAFVFRGLEAGKHQVIIRSRTPYMDSVFVAETELGKRTSLEDILLDVVE